MRFVIVSVTLIAACARGSEGASADAMVDSCGDMCDADGDGVFDGLDKCAETPAGAPVNKAGCADSQVMPTLEPMFPPYHLEWTSAGDIGRAGGLTWTYAGIDRTDLFHIYWIICDDPNLFCGVSLNGPIDSPGESWIFSATDSMLAAGKVVFSNTTSINLDGGGSAALTGRLTVQIVGDGDAPLPFKNVATLGVMARLGAFGAEIPGTGYKVTALIEVKDMSTPFTPYLDYFDAAPTMMGGPSASVSFGGSFYDE